MISSGYHNQRVLSIQSHVVSGYVGNKAAVFPLQLLGFDVDTINSVQFSNHTGYPKGWEGDVLDGTRLLDLVNGLERNGLLCNDLTDSDSGRIGHILTGYIGSESFLRAVVTVVQKLRALNSKCRYICDPVLGDAGKFYVPENLVQIYRNDVLPIADVITPNQFETEQLTGVPIKTESDAQHACSILHDMGVTIVLITSISLQNADKQLKDSTKIAMFASRRRFTGFTEGDADEQYILYAPLIPGHFTGTGDVCAALFLAWTSNMSDESTSEDSLKSALEKLGGTMHAIVNRTANHAEKTISTGSEANRVFSREMQLIQSRDDILSPNKIFTAIKIQPKSKIST